MRDLLDRLNAEAPAAKHFVVFDACRNALKLKDAGGKALSQPKGFQPVRDIPGGMLIAFATAEGELASDQGADAGPYARALAGEIVKPGVEAFTVFRNAQLQVSESIGQKPWMQSSPMPAVYFAGREAAGQPSPSAPAPTVGEAARVEWGIIKDSTDLRILKAFRDQFGKANPYYDALAEQRIAALERAKPDEQPSWWQSLTSGKTEAPKPAEPQVAVVAPPRPVPARPPEAACDGLLVAVAQPGVRPCIEAGSGESFRDCPDCPEMVIVPGGQLHDGLAGKRAGAV